MRIQADLEYRKLHAAHVTAERLRWLQDLRLRAAQMFRDLEEQVDLSRRPRPIDRAGCEAIQKRLDELSDRVLLEANVVWLMLNPKKAEQFALRKAISDAQSFVLSLGTAEGAASADIEDYRNCKQSAVDALTAIGVVTWQKVKGLK